MPTPKQTHNPTAFGSAAQVNTSHCIPISTNPQAFIYSDTKSHTVCNAYHQHATSHTDTLIIYIAIFWTCPFAIFCICGPSITTLY